MSLPFFTFKEFKDSSKMQGYSNWLNDIKYAKLPPLSKPPCEASPNCCGGTNDLGLWSPPPLLDLDGVSLHPAWIESHPEIVLNRSFVVDPAGQCQPRPTDLPELKDMFSPEPDL